MKYHSDLELFQKLLQNLHLNVSLLKKSSDPVPDITLGLYSLIKTDFDFQGQFWNRIELFEENKIYRVNNSFWYRYLLFQLPDTDEPTFALIGPYALMNISEKMTLDTARRLNLPATLYPQLQKFYEGIPQLSDESVLLSIINVFGERFWGRMDNFSLQDVENSVIADLDPVAERPDYKEPEEALLSMQILEDRYAGENELMLAVSQGQTLKAEAFLNRFGQQVMEKRSADPIRNEKNYLIILNTLLRKAAENGAVHPLHIDSLSSRFAHRIEMLATLENVPALQKEMVHKYCLLVKNHSMKGYSLLIQKVLTRIDSDLTADLGLKAQAELLQVNPSYLPALFKKETGSTLTEYVNKKRIEHALFLLNSTNMQIQTVAQYCGIADVNYFTKTFKKLIGKTPKEYRATLGRV